jgi:hypothetical protein
MTINIDFDYTCIATDNPSLDIGSIPVLKKLVDNGHKLILFTCRSNMPNHLPDGRIHHRALDEAVEWFRVNGIPLYGIQVNPRQHEFTDSPKSLADLTIDDTCLGIPLIYNKEKSHRAYVDWKQAEQLLMLKGYLKMNYEDL